MMCFPHLRFLICIFTFGFFFFSGTAALEARSTLPLFRVEPDGLARHIPVDTVFQLTWDSSVTPVSELSGEIVLLEGTVPVRLQHSWNRPRRRLFIQPVRPLQPARDYSLVVYRSFTAGMKKDLIFAYATEKDAGPPPLRVISTDPADGSVVHTEQPTIRIQFDRIPYPPNPDDLQDLAGIFSGTERLPGHVRCNQQKRQLEIIPYIGLTSGREYRVLIGPDIRNQAGRPMKSEYSFSFQTDLQLFYLESSLPDVQRTELQSFDRILLTFSESLDENHVFEDFIHVVNERNQYTVPGKFQVYRIRNLLFVPDFPLPAGQYRVVLNSRLASRYGNRLKHDVELPFTVLPDRYNMGVGK